ncbi:MAG: 5' nucleotidase, NT5C type, partial [Cetobacterium sp.]
KDEILIDKYKKQIDDRMEQDRVTFSRVLNIKNLKQFGVDYTEDTAQRIADSIKEYIDCLHGREKRVIWVDFDDVVVQTLESAVELYNEDHGTSITVDMFSEWDTNKVACGFSGYFGKIDFEEIKEKNNAIHWLRELNKHYTIKIATASASHTFIKKEKWILKNMPFIPWKNINCIRDKSLLSGYAIIDDGAHNLDNSICDRRYLYCAPHNQSARNYDLRIKSLEDIYDILVKGNIGWE